MKFVALVSGGKDSFYSIMECIRNGHELVGCAHLSPRKRNPVGGDGGGEEEEESYMYQTAASECIPTLVEECLGVPLVLRECVGRSKNTSLVYDHDGEEEQEEGQQSHSHSPKIEDEVEDLYELLKDVQRRFPSVQGISSGAILSTYQRTRIESVCCRLGLTPLGYMWRIGPQRELLECMLRDGIDAVLVKVASPPGLMPQKHLNKTLGQLHYGGIFDRLKDRFDFHICGEGGEYETLVVDCPLFRKKLALTDVEIIEGHDGVGVLKVNECCAVEKESDAIIWGKTGPALFERIHTDDSDDDDNLDEEKYNVHSSTTEPSSTDLHATVEVVPRVMSLPLIRVMPGGLAHVSEIVSQQIFQTSDLNDGPTDAADTEAQLAVLEAQSIFLTFQEALKRIQWTMTDEKLATSTSQDFVAATAKDVVFVHLYLSSISHFAKINAFYKDFFGTVLPPSRSCVAVGRNVLPGGRRVMMDCIIQRGSGEYMRIQPDAKSNTLTNISPCNEKFIKEHKNNPHHKLRATLHVQTISHWAPICVGPYSQANTVRSGVIFMAGQIGLNPGTMTLIDDCWKKQLRQSWKNAASVLDALEGSLSDTISGVIYIGSGVAIDRSNGSSSVRSQVWNESDAICQQSILTNGGIKAGYVDESNSSKNDSLYGGFEDYETYKEIMGEENLDANDDDKGGPKEQAKNVPLLMVSIPEMPVGAISEVELVCATSRASSCLDLSTYLGWETHFEARSANKNQVDVPSCTNTAGSINWDTGYDGICYDATQNTIADDPSDAVNIESVVRSIGKGCAAVAFATASIPNSPNVQSWALDWNAILWDMMDEAICSIEKSSGLGRGHVLNIRLFHSSHSGDDSLLIRNALNAVVGAEWGTRPKWGKRKQQHNALPATSVIPVESMHMSPHSHTHLFQSNPILAMQITVADLVHMETEMWIHHNRAM